MFEAGALTKSLDNSRVIPLLFGVNATDIQGPLVQFQSSDFSKSEVRKLVGTINTVLEDNALDILVLDSVFEKWWPELEEKINKEKANQRKTVDKKDKPRSDRELLEELLDLTRSNTYVHQPRPMDPLLSCNLSGIENTFEWRTKVIYYFLENTPDESIYDNFIIDKDRSINIYYTGNKLSNADLLKKNIYKLFRVNANIVHRL